MGQINKTFLIRGKRYFSQDYKTRFISYNKFKNEITNKWSRPSYMFTGCHGGHISALRCHLSNKYFVIIDLADFFETITDTKVFRSLSKIGINSSKAFKMSGESTVSLLNNKVLARGFSQASILADLVFDQSLIGSTIRREISSTISVYCDDIILSGNTIDELNRDLGLLLLAIERANFSINYEKSSSIAAELTAFNIILKTGSLCFTHERFLEFVNKLEHFLLFAIRAERYRPLDFVDEILDYVSSVNSHQGNELRQIAETAHIYRNYRRSKLKNIVKSLEGHQTTKPRF